MSCPTTIEVAPSGRATTCANAEPIAKATASFSCCGTRPRTSYALMNSDSLGALMRQSLPIAQDAQVTTTNGLDGAAHLGLRSLSRCGNGGRCLSGPAGLAHRVGQRQQVVLGGAGVHELRGEADDLPAARDCLALGMHGAQVVGVRLGIGSQRSQNRGLVGVDIGQRRDGAT